MVPLAPETPGERLHFEEGEQLNRQRKKNRRIDLFKGIRDFFFGLDVEIQ